MQRLFWNNININGHKIFFTVTDIGLSFIGSPDRGLSQVQDFYHQPFEFVYNSKKTHLYKKELKEYLKGKRKSFDLPTDLLKLGTPFQNKVWETVAKIPYGETITYSDLAHNMNSEGIRSVASAIAKNPLYIVIPCHRVRRKDHRETNFRGNSQDTQWQKYLLDLEANTVEKSAKEYKQRVKRTLERSTKRLKKS